MQQVNLTWSSFWGLKSCSSILLNYCSLGEFSLSLFHSNKMNTFCTIELFWHDYKTIKVKQETFSNPLRPKRPSPQQSQPTLTFLAPLIPSYLVCRCCSCSDPHERLFTSSPSSITLFQHRDLESVLDWKQMLFCVLIISTVWKMLWSVV